MKAITFEERSRIEKILYNNEINYEDVSLKNNALIITIKNGDWKHTHLFLEYIMSEQGYYNHEKTIIEEDNDDDEDDSYSAVYTFLKK